MWKIWWAPNNASKWQMGFNSAFEVLMAYVSYIYISIQWCINQTQQNFIMFIIVLGQLVSILIESSSGPSKNTDPYLAKCILYF